MKSLRVVLLVLVGFCFVGCASGPVEPVMRPIQEPSEFFGFELGTDKKLAGPDKIIEYFETMDRLSDRMIFQEVGRTVDDHAFVMAVISSAVRSGEEKLVPKNPFICKSIQLLMCSPVKSHSRECLVTIIL